MGCGGSKPVAVAEEKPIVVEEMVAEYVDLQQAKQRVEPPIITQARRCVCDTLRHFFEQRIALAGERLDVAEKNEQRERKEYENLDRTVKVALKQGMSALDVSARLNKEFMDFVRSENEASQALEQLQVLNVWDSENTELDARLGEKLAYCTGVGAREGKVLSCAFGTTYEENDELVILRELQNVSGLLVEVVYARINWQHAVDALSHMSEEVRPALPAVRALSRRPLCWCWPRVFAVGVAGGARLAYDAVQAVL